MYTKKDLLNDIEKIGVDPAGTLLIHSSMKAVGEVEGRADTVIDAFLEYMKDGLLIFPTHTWSEENNKNNIFNPQIEPSCVGILTNLFMKRKNVVRSMHPTHSVAAAGKGAKEYVRGEEFCNTPCPRDGCWGKLYDREAQILFLGCSLKTNTFIHGVEEWKDIPDRLAAETIEYKIVKEDGQIIKRPLFPHESSHGDVSQNYDKIEKPLLEKNIAVKGKICDAVSYLCEARRMADLVTEFLHRDSELFADDSPVPENWYKS